MANHQKVKGFYLWDYPKTSVSWPLITMIKSLSATQLMNALSLE